MEGSKYRHIKIIILFTVISLSVISVSGCAQYYQHHYYVKINGLDAYHGHGTTRILVPVPVMDNKPLYSGGADKAWNISIIDHATGPMIEFSTEQSDLSNISAEFSSGNGYRPVNYSYDAKAYTTGIYLRPMCTLPRLYESRKFIKPYEFYEYTSYVYLDENLTESNDSLPSAIALDIHFEGSHEEAGQSVTTRNMYVNDTIAPGMTGIIPVIVRVID